MKNSISFEELLSSTHRYGLDEEFQRSYEWNSTLAINFLKDIINSHICDDNGNEIPYHIGQILTYNDTEKDIKNIYDGQQRLTTLYLFLSNIYEHLELCGDNCEDFRQEIIREKRYYDENGKQRVETKKTLSLKYGDDKVFEEIIKHGYEGLTKFEKKTTLAKNYKLITTKLTDGMKKIELANLQKKVLKVTLFEHECQSREEAIHQFNVTNSAQQPLHPSHLAITYLKEEYLKSNRLDKNKAYSLYSLQQENSMEELKSIFGLYVYFKTGKYPSKEFVGYLKKISAKEDDIIKSFIDFYDNVYKEIKDPKESFFKNPFCQKNALRVVRVGLFYNRSSCLYSLEREIKNTIYRHFEWAFFSNKMQNNGGASVMERFIHILSTYEAKEGTDDTIKYFDDAFKRRNLFIDPEALKNYTFSGGKNAEKEKGLVELLLRVEYQLKCDGGEKETITHNDIPSIEHIHPRSIRKNTTYNCSDKYTRTIGNLTLLGGGCNSSTSNKEYSRKREYYLKSPYWLTSKLIGEKYSVWNDKNILKCAEDKINCLKKFYRID